MPSAVPQLNSLAEVQRIAVSSAVRARQVTLKYLYPAGVSTSLYTVTVTASDSARFESERVGLRLVINGVSVTVPIAWTTAAIDDAIEGALGGSYASADTSFGVRKVRGCVADGRCQRDGRNRALPAPTHSRREGSGLFC